MVQQLLPIDPRFLEGRGLHLGGGEDRGLRAVLGGEMTLEVFGRRTGNWRT